jgi:hypothetical protein
MFILSLKGRQAIICNTAGHKNIQDNIKEPSSRERQGGTRSALIKRNNKRDDTNLRGFRIPIVKEKKK